MRFWLILLLFVGGAAAAGVLWLRSFNYSGSAPPVALAQCQPVIGVSGPEDISLDTKRGLAFVSSLDRRDPSARGAIHRFDVNDPLSASAWRDRTGGTPEAFQPLGLHYYEDDETRLLFVVNAANAAVETFEVTDSGDLIHVETFAERRLTSPNNVVAVGSRRFYVTNDVQPGRDSWQASLHFLMRARSGSVLYVDGDVWRLAAEGLRFANGLALSPDGETLFVAETAAANVQTYRRDAESGALSPAAAIALRAAPDNLTVAEDGALWVGALPRPLMTPALKRNPAARAPSQVIRVSPDGRPETVYRNDGAEQSAATVAALLGEKLLIGALYEEKFLICDAPPASEESTADETASDE